MGALALTLLASLPQEAQQPSFAERLHERWNTPEKLADGVAATFGTGFTAGVLASVGFWLLARTRGRSS